MARITLKGTEFQTVGDLPAAGSSAPDSQIVDADLQDVSLSSIPGKKILNIFPSVDTPVCATSVRAFNEKAGSMDGVRVLNISADLPFAQKRFCGAENLEGVGVFSTMRGALPDEFGVRIQNGPLAGLCSRAVVVLDENNKVLHAEQVPEIAQEPNYDAALASI